VPPASLAGLKMDLGLIVSNDAIHYREPVRNFIEIPHGGPNDWDSESILQANAFANTDTETLIWYSHWFTSRPDTIPPLPEKLSEEHNKKKDAIGLARLPRDRFGYFSKLLPMSQARNRQEAKPLESSCLTKRLRLDRASSLFVNLDDVTSEKPLQIALVDDAERPLPGYTAKLSQNGLKVAVGWSAKKLLPANTNFRVKVTWPAGVDSAKLYAVYIEQQ
jgi:hypothetical protein